MESLVYEMQKYICDSIEDEKGFTAEDWTRDDGTFNKGRGRTCYLEEGSIIERGGVCVSTMEGKLSKIAIESMKSRGHSDIDSESLYYVTGLSVIIHSSNPLISSFHLNIRYFKIGDEWWFGGGSDLTPCYINDDLFRSFHSALKDACDSLCPSLYPKFKLQADEYFYLPIRREHRGIGGIFYDDLNEFSYSQLLDFSRRSVTAAVDVYAAHVRACKNVPFTESMKYWQSIRRGRYVEFNLIYDRGTKFGINAPHVRIDTILLSLPGNTRWKYNHKPESGSAEESMLEILKNPRDWII